MERYEDQHDTHMLADYCLGIQRESPDMKHANKNLCSEKSDTYTFILILWIKVASIGRKLQKN